MCVCVVFRNGGEGVGKNGFFRSCLGCATSAQLQPGKGECYIKAMLKEGDLELLLALCISQQQIFSLGASNV